MQTMKNSLKIITSRRLSTFFVLASTLLLNGCEMLGYYSQAARGQWQILNNQKPIDALLAQTSSEAKLSNQLELILQLRQFADQHLHLPVAENYLNYVDVGRPFVVWNVFAAPPLSIEPISWCFPIAGCVNYRGYFNEHQAQEKAARLAEPFCEKLV